MAVRSIYLIMIATSVLCDDDIVKIASTDASKGETRATRQAYGTDVLGDAVSSLDSEPAAAIQSAAMSLRPEARNLYGSADHCVLHKGVLNQGGFSQSIMYKSNIPDLKEFTLCHWHKFYNHSTDHPIFTYTGRGGKKSEIRSWVSNSYHSSFYQLGINGHTIYRINYPIRLHKWYHACQSWNGRTGEWQMWINSERVGRGFYNLVVGKVIKGSGTAITGQDSKTFRHGFMGEVTLLMLYKAALTAGKAYYNHKHHHAHKFHHDDKLGVDDPENTDGGTRVNLGSDVLAPNPLQPVIHIGPGGAPGQGPKKEGLLIGMQLEPRLPIDELAVKPGLNLLNAAGILGPFSNVRLFKRDHNGTTRAATTNRKERSHDESAVGDQQGFDSKKISTKSNDETVRTRRNTAKDMETADMMKMETYIKTKDPKKRTPAVPFGILSEYDLSNFYGGKGSFNSAYVQQSIPTKLKTSVNPSVSDDNYVEPAEWEVKSVMSLCSACGEDPFRKANVLSWLESPKRLMGGALFVEANQQCKDF